MQKQSLLKNFTKFTEKQCQNICARVSVSCEFWDIFKNSFFYKTHPAVASVHAKAEKRPLQETEAAVHIISCPYHVHIMSSRHPCSRVISIKLQSNFIEITLRHGCSPVNLLHIIRILFPKSTFGEAASEEIYF